MKQNGIIGVVYANGRYIHSSMFPIGMEEIFSGFMTYNCLCVEKTVDAFRHTNEENSVLNPVRWRSD